MDNSVPVETVPETDGDDLIDEAEGEARPVEEGEEELEEECEEAEVTEEEEGHGINFDFDDEPLYTCSHVSKASICVFLMLLTLQFNLTGECVGVLLLLLKTVLPKENKIPNSLYSLKKYLNKLFNIEAPNVHQYCSICKSFLRRTDKRCKRRKCVKQSCKVKTFITMDLKKQLRKILSGKMRT